MPVAHVNGVKVPYDDTGGEGVPLVLAHGFMMDRRMFAPQVEALSHRFRVITWDQRGHGEADDSASPFSYWELAEDQAGLLDHLGISRAVVGGMSQGGFIGLRFALSHPDRTAGLVLIDSQAGTEFEDKRQQYDLMRSVWDEEGPSELMGGMVAAIILGRYEGNPEWIARWIDRYPNGLGHIYELLMERDDVTGRLGEIEAPALVLHGDVDDAIPMERAEAMSAGLSGSPGVVVVPDGSHASNLTNPEAVNQAMADFLGSL